ncbi:MAG: DegT/DnrJ/EryC1/StrS family aminotransferase [Acidobacteria bacterium]|nr:MAG: DegT/DnrJ/EryC1/StrS family aminotransferase [Acidobacteriota bacterium]
MKKGHLTRREFALGSASVALIGAVASPRSAKAAALGPDSKPAILGGPPVRTQPFPSWPTLESVDEGKVIDSLRQRKWCRLGANITTEFEGKWAQGLGAKFAIGVVNGTNALYAALNALEVGPGDEVLVPAYTFVATVNAVIQQFALPVFVDTDLKTQQMDTSKLESKITENTRCIMPVHMGGNVANLDEIKRIAAKHRLSIVEDACQAHYSEWGGKKAGSIGDVGCFSFQASKILPCGEGGAVVTSREDLYDRMHAFQNNGRDRLTGTRNGYLYQGSNLRMTEFQAALLLGQLTRFEKICKVREENAKHLTALLKQIGGVEPAGMYEQCTRNTYYVYLARYNPAAFKGLSRAAFLKAIAKEGIPMGAGYVPLNKEPFLEKTFRSRLFGRIYSDERLKRYREMNQCPANDQLAQEGLFLSQTLLIGTKQDVEQVAEAVARIQKHAVEIAKVS